MNVNSANWLSLEVEAKSAKDYSICQEDRKYVGFVVLWKPNVKRKVECKSNRLYGILVCLANDVTILLLNAYIPCDGS